MLNEPQYRSAFQGAVPAALPAAPSGDYSCSMADLPELGSPSSRWKLRRLAAMAARRLLLVPILLVIMVLMLVWGATHRLPGVDRSLSVTPANINLFYRDVELMTADGTRLAGWYIPAWSADNLVRQSDRLRQRRAGLVLCHGAWSNRGQMLYLAPALHAAGYELLLIDLRGCGMSEGRTGLGLDEWQDVTAAVEWLQAIGPADPQRIGVVATDCSAAAAIRAACNKKAVRVVVADRPCPIRAAVRQRFDAMYLPHGVGGPVGHLFEWGLALTRGRNLSEASASWWAAQLDDNQLLAVAARKGDRLVGESDVEKVFSVAHCRKATISNAPPSKTRSQPALLPARLVDLLKQRLPAMNADQLSGTGGGEP